MALDHQAVAAILDEAILALSRFDCARLQSLEQQISTLSESKFEFNAAGIGELHQRRRLLERLLIDCDTNLNALKRLHARNRMDLWLR